MNDKANEKSRADALAHLMTAFDVLIDGYQEALQDGPPKERADTRRELRLAYQQALMDASVNETGAECPERVEPPRHIIDAAMDTARKQYGHGVTRASIVEIWKALGKPWYVADAPADARPTDDALWDQTERDNHQKWADKLANAIADHFNVDIGEHSSMNNPWSEAFDAISNAEVSAPADAGEAMTDAARDVLAERRRQVEAEGWTPQHDDEHDMGEMAHVAAWYSIDPMMRDALDERGLGFWPWAQEWWKPTTPRRDLVKAGALILAEIERLDRAARTQGDSHE